MRRDPVAAEHLGCSTLFGGCALGVGLLVVASAFPDGSAAAEHLFLGLGVAQAMVSVCILRAYAERWMRFSYRLRGEPPNPGPGDALVYCGASVSLGLVLLHFLEMLLPNFGGFGPHIVWRSILRLAPVGVVVTVPMVFAMVVGRESARHALPPGDARGLPDSAP